MSSVLPTREQKFQSVRTQRTPTTKDLFGTSLYHTRFNSVSRFVYPNIIIHLFIKQIALQPSSNNFKY